MNIEWNLTFGENGFGAGKLKCKRIRAFLPLEKWGCFWANSFCYKMKPGFYRVATIYFSFGYFAQYFCWKCRGTRSLRAVGKHSTQNRNIPGHLREENLPMIIHKRRRKERQSELKTCKTTNHSRTWVDVRARQALDVCLSKPRKHELKRAKDCFHNIGLKRTAWLYIYPETAKSSDVLLSGHTMLTRVFKCEELRIVARWSVKMAGRLKCLDWESGFCFAFNLRW